MSLFRCGAVCSGIACPPLQLVRGSITSGLSLALCLAGWGRAVSVSVLCGTTATAGDGVHSLPRMHWRTSIQGMPCAFGFWALIQSAECGGMTASDANINQHATNTSPRNLPVQLRLRKNAVLASFQLVGPTFHQINMHPSGQ